MDKLERLLNLTAALLDTDRVLSAEELRQRIGGYPKTQAAFRRTFERDKDDLRSLGIPLRVLPVAGSDPPIDGYRILRSEYIGQEIHFEPDELAALHLAARLIPVDGTQTGLLKLGGTTESLEIQEIGQVPFNDNLAALIAAAGERSAVAFLYRDARREVEPWQLSFVRGHWYLAAWDRQQQDQRLFRVDRINSKIEKLDAATEPRTTPTNPAQLRSWELGDGEPVDVKVVVDSEQAVYFGYLIGQKISAEGSATEITLKVRNFEAFRSFILTFLEHAEVLEPQSVRDDMVQWLKELA